MIERPEISDEAIRAALEEHWGIRVLEIAFLPVGNETGTWVFRAGAFLVKVMNRLPLPAAVHVSLDLYEQGISHVVAPVASLEGCLLASAANYWLLLYPFIEGQTAMEAGLTDAQWGELGSVLREIHDTKLREWVESLVPRETFAPKWAGMVRRLDGFIAESGFSDPSQQALAEFWSQRRTEILAITARCEEFGRMAAAQNVPYVLCHADIHLANVLVDFSGGLHIVDWNQPIFAPVERDLMFLVEETGRGLIEQPREEKLFLKGYGPVEIDRLAMAYYRYEWAVQEFGDYGERVFLLTDIGEVTRAAAVQGFMELFNPGDVVESACEWDQNLNFSG